MVMTQQSEMLRDVRFRNVHKLGQLFDGFLTIAQKLYKLQALGLARMLQT